ncbi:MAG: hypothetical protein ACLFO1_08815 [Spirochaetaceae bacterium]
MDLEDKYPGLRDLPEDLRRIVHDHMMLADIADSAEHIRARLELKSRAIEARLESVYRALESFPGLNQTLPTGFSLPGERVKDQIDLTMRVVTSSGKRQMRLIWKTHNVHKIEAGHSGFTLGDLTLVAREPEYVQTQVPILEVHLAREVGEGGLFKKERDEGLIARFRLNRSWIEETDSGSRAELDSSFDSPLDLVDFLTDNYRYPEYGLVIQLINEVHNQILTYLDNKRRMLDSFEA